MRMIRWGLLGCGDIAKKRVASAIADDPISELVAAYRRDVNALSEFCASFGGAEPCESAAQLIARDDIHAIYIATPVHLHCEQTIAAAEAGKHVLVEKPMALDPDQCQRMIDACQQNDVTLGVAYYRRFYPAVEKIQQLLASGTLGRPLSILATTGNTNRFPQDDWRVVKDLGGGGPLMDIGSHRLDLFLQLVGNVRSVQSVCSQSPDYESEDVAALLLEFESGCHGVLQCYFGTANTPDRLEVIGTDGRVTVDALNSGEMKIVIGKDQELVSLPPEPNFHAPLIRDFANAIAEKSSPKVTGEIGKQTNDVIAKAYEANRQN